jgi:hypothetical protein
MAIQDYLGGLNIFGTPIPTGILDPQQEDKLRNQALVSGIIGTAANYLAQPKNLGAGSALPYLAKAYIGGMGSSQGTVDTALNNLYRQQLLAGRNQDKLYNVDGTLVDEAGQVVYQSPTKQQERKTAVVDGVLVDANTGEVVYKSPQEARGQASQSSDIQLINRYNETFAKYQQDPKNPLLRNEVKALELKLGLQQPLAAPQTQAEIVKKSLTPLETKVEEKSAQDLVDFTIGGGFSDVQKGLSQLEIAKQTLQQQPEGRITGKLVGAQDDTGLLKYTNPAAQDTKEQVQEIAQRNLRLILGPQFTAKEGEALINRVYNPALPQSVNVKRLDLLQEQMTSAAKTKQEAVDYYNTNGTLKGFKGKLYNSTSDFLNEYNSKIKGTEKAGPTQSMPASTGFKEGMRTKSKSGKPMIFRNGQWEYE